ncbi:Biotin carboxylase [Micromonospora phaseoli]|uniref:Biotin carboxylase n=1 Tax=Micromonospora phaseoli TaxID=1144548 RepID=A0A1H6V408_9ACTN|nr:siderophore biosynthesis protein [Micromonospora phaseoli]PZV93781.1 biotin carboxylase [Micromonospora phaseoli]GIJ79943.1 carboxylate--amine ligase [Micromonospora phaseoli]SEI97674.1 Biotin carboxylase [Micromonospora phaseoli]
MLYLTALNPTDAVLDGLLPAAGSLGVPVTVLTDRPDDWPAAVPTRHCPVRQPDAVTEAVRAGPTAAGLLSNSDHLQAATAQAARRLGLPGKDPESARRCKDKAATRRAIAAAGLDHVRAHLLEPGAPATFDAFPAVVKPRDGVASEDAYLVTDAGDLARRVTEIRRRRPDEPLVVEEYLPGDVQTHDTLGDAHTRRVLGGWRTTLGAPPTFTEQCLEWAPATPAVTAALHAQLDALGVRFGACHTEFVVQDGRPRLIEVNDRLIGDRMDLVLAELLGVPLFEYVIRLHLGESVADLGLPEPATVGRAARVEYVCAEHGGTLVAAPGPVDALRDGVRLGCRPLRAVGSTAEWTGTNRDYLAVLHGIGPDPTGVRRALAGFRADLDWVITT